MHSVIVAGVATALLRRNSFADEILVKQLLADIVVAGLFTLVLLVLERKFCIHCYQLFTERSAKLQANNM